MYWRDEVTLEAVAHGTGPEGYSQDDAQAKTVFADVLSVKRSEFYSARKNDINLSITAKLRAADYDGQERLVWKGKRYKVERAYSKGGDTVELNCSDYKEVAENEP